MTTGKSIWVFVSSGIARSCLFLPPIRSDFYFRNSLILSMQLFSMRSRELLAGNIIVFYQAVHLQIILSRWKKNSRRCDLQSILPTNMKTHPTSAPHFKVSKTVTSKNLCMETRSLKMGTDIATLWLLLAFMFFPANPNPLETRVVVPLSM